MDIIPVSDYKTDTPITGVEWMGAQALVLLNAKEELRVVDPFALAEVESASARGMQIVYHTKLGEPSYHGSLRKSRGRVSICIYIHFYLIKSDLSAGITFHTHRASSNMAREN